MNIIDEKQTESKNLFMRIIHEKCPQCGKADVYIKKKSFFELPIMKDRCNNCNYFFDREPGYFLGAMYISYGLALLQGISTFLILYLFFPTMQTIFVVVSILAVIFSFSLKNYKLSRIIYMHIFPQ